MSDTELEAKDEVAPLDLDELKANVSAALEDADKEVLVDPASDDEVVYTEAEQKAISMGWNPDSEALEGTDKEFISADEFVRNKSFFDEIKKLKREVRKQQKVTEAFKQQNEIVAEKSYNKAMLDLKKAKIQAAEDEDFTSILAIDDRIDELREEQETQKAVKQAQFTAHDWDEAYEDFVETNSWYSDNRVMQTFADSIGTKYVQSNPGISPAEAYEYVKAEVDKEFKEAPAKETKPRAAAVASPRRSAAKTTKHTLDDIPDEHRAIANTLIKTKQVSVEDYLKQYFPEDYS